MLLAVMLPTAWAFASQKVTIVVTGQGSIVADKVQAMEGELVTLTVSSDEGWKLKRRTLLVEQVTNTAGDSAQLTRGVVPTVGAFVTLSKQSDNSYTFTMPNTDVEVRATFVEYVTSTTTIDAKIDNGESETTTSVTINITIETETGDVEISQVTQPDNPYNSSLTITIPSVVTDSEGKEHPVTSIASGAFMGQTNVTDIFLPDTDDPLDIEEGALLLDNETGDSHQVATIHTPLSLLDDYALMSSLSENYMSGKICASATAIHHYWTFSCGVDIKLPEGVKLYTVKRGTTKNVEILEIENAVLIKANNGVLLACPDNGGNAYEMVVQPSTERPSGTKPATDNAHSYPGNLMEPVIVGQHYDANAGYFILYNNEFYPITDENQSKQIPACKAVLHLSK